MDECRDYLPGQKKITKEFEVTGLRFETWTSREDPWRYATTACSVSLHSFIRSLFCGYSSTDGPILNYGLRKI